jgi:hypothetical protein
MTTCFEDQKHPPLPVIFVLARVHFATEYIDLTNETSSVELGPSGEAASCGTIKKCPNIL